MIANLACLFLCLTVTDLVFVIGDQHLQSEIRLSLHNYAINVQHMLHETASDTEILVLRLHP